MKVFNTKLLSSSPKLGNVEKMVNNYFYSSNYKLIPYQTTNGISYDIVGTKGKLDNFIVKQEKGRYKFYELELSHIIKYPSYEVIMEMERYCEGMPPLVYDSNLYENKKCTINMTLKHYLDDLFYNYLKAKDKAKFDKKMAKEMLKSIVIGNDNEYRTIGFKLPLQEMWENYPDHFKLTLKNKLEKYKEQGYRLLNTNIPQQFLTN